MSTKLRDIYARATYLDDKGNPVNITPPNEAEEFTAWLEGAFGNQSNFAKRVGYSRGHVNEICNGKQPIPKVFKAIRELSEQVAELKQNRRKE